MENPTPPLVPAYIPTQLLPEKQKRAVTTAVTGMRIHELAVLRMLNRTYFVTEGYPIPVIMGTPGDAFAQFKYLCAQGANNPFAYLLDAKDTDGTPLYEPYPGNVRYPIIAVKRLGWSPRINQSYGTRQFRRAAYVTVSPDAKQNDLANVVSQQMPTAWDFRYQIDHYARQPESQAEFIHNTTRLFQYAGGEMQVWIAVKYPGIFGRDHRTIRVALTGTIDDASLEEPGDQAREYRTSYSITVEGYSPDLDYRLWPTFWQEALKEGVALSPQQLENLFTMDLRNVQENTVFNALPNLPPK